MTSEWNVGDIVSVNYPENRSGEVLRTSTRHTAKAYLSGDRHDRLTLFKLR
jgi:hypothetical protein